AGIQLPSGDYVPVQSWTGGAVDTSQPSAFEGYGVPESGVEPTGISIEPEALPGTEFPGTTPDYGQAYTPQIDLSDINAPSLSLEGYNPAPMDFSPVDNFMSPQPIMAQAQPTPAINDVVNSLIQSGPGFGGSNQIPMQNVGVPLTIAPVIGGIASSNTRTPGGGYIGGGYGSGIGGGGTSFGTNTSGLYGGFEGGSLGGGIGDPGIAGLLGGGGGGAFGGFSGPLLL